MDSEKVLKGLDICAHPPLGRWCKGCPYFENASCNIDLMMDALALLKAQEEEIQNLRRENHNILTQFHEWAKEQEAVEPKTEPSAKGYWFTCGACGWWLFEVRDTVHFDDRKRIHYCASCGRSVKWNEIN